MFRAFPSCHNRIGWLWADGPIEKVNSRYFADVMTSQPLWVPVFFRVSVSRLPRFAVMICP